MSRKVAYRFPALQALPTALAFAPREAIDRQMRAAEALMQAVEGEREYPIDFALFRITGFRPRQPSDRTALGRELVHDLGALVLDLSLRLKLDGTEREGGALSPDEAARTFDVSFKTMQRLREDGLCAHWIERNGTPRVWMYRESIARFVAQHAQRIEAATRFRRFSGEESRAMLNAAGELMEHGHSLNSAALVLADKHGRSHEGVRLLLMRHFGRTRSAEARKVERASRFAERAWRFGVDLTKIAARIGRSESLVRSIVDHRRAVRLRAMPLPFVALPTFELYGAEETLLAPQSVREGLVVALEDSDAIALLKSARACRKSRAFVRDASARRAQQVARGAAMHFLIRRAKQTLQGCGRRPSRAVLDAIETDLRWAAQLRRALVASALTIASARMDQFFAGEPELLRVDELRTLLRALRDRLVTIVAQYDPSRQDLEALAGLEADFVLAHFDAQRSRRAASKQSLSEGTSMEPLLDAAAPWLSEVDRLWKRRAALASLSAPQRELLLARYGWHGSAPCTLAQVAERVRTSVALATRKLYDAETALRRA
ncbi:MAG: hypothetical protein EXS10_05075 [Phycisphaerales bacterium]|nr:hypothetical protein [Phycisphaerales bacterium]